MQHSQQGQKGKSWWLKSRMAHSYEKLESSKDCIYKSGLGSTLARKFSPKGLRPQIKRLKTWKKNEKSKQTVSHIACINIEELFVKSDPEDVIPSAFFLLLLLGLLFWLGFLLLHTMTQLKNKFDHFLLVSFFLWFRPWFRFRWLVVVILLHARCLLGSDASFLWFLLWNVLRVWK